MKIYLVRHAQTEANYQGLLQGRTNTPLSEAGVRDAVKLKEKLKGKPLDICITSPLSRTWQTAMILAGDKTYILEDERLIERNLGNFEGKSRTLYDAKKYWDYELNSGEEGVEKIQDVISRAKSFLDELKEKYSDKSVLIVSHGAVVRALDHLLNNVDFKTKKDLTKMPIENSFFKEYEI